jgi:hypothetical protein
MTSPLDFGRGEMWNRTSVDSSPMSWHTMCTLRAAFVWRCNSKKNKQVERTMKRISGYMREGKVGWILLWLLGVPIPILLIFFLIRGCT